MAQTSARVLSLVRTELDLALKFSSISEAPRVSGAGLRLHHFHLFLQQFPKRLLSFPSSQADKDRSGGSEPAGAGTGLSCWLS